jgi:oxygen-independent coproporphyrinogen-3 oxidase
MAFTFNPARGFGVYIHWPYCARICPYCDFNVYAAKTRDPAPLLAAIHRDLAGWRERSGPRVVDAIFFGGGTPSLLSGPEIAALIAEVDRLWGVRPGAEITLEANPDDRARFADFAAAGVDRLSLGVQSLDDARLKFLGRTHSAQDALAAIDAARGHFRSTSLDFIYALPEETLDGWRTELARALQLGADHLSLYELSIEPGAVFARSVKRGQWTPADDDRAADLYELTQAMTEAAGLPAYEISNHARSLEHRSRHNTIYWRSGDWVGAGPGAHGRLTAGGERLALSALDRPGDYLKAVDASGWGVGDSEVLDALAQARERVAMGLRVVEGFSLSDIAELGLALDAAGLRQAIELQLVDVAYDRVQLSLAGRLTADRVAAMIAP